MNINDYNVLTNLQNMLLMNQGQVDNTGVNYDYSNQNK